MVVEPAVTEAHVVVATVPITEGTVVGPTLYAVIADTAAQAEAAVQAVAAPDAVVAATGGPLNSETVERLALVPGEAKQIG